MYKRQLRICSAPVPVVSGAEPAATMASLVAFDGVNLFVWMKCRASSSLCFLAWKRAYRSSDTRPIAYPFSVRRKMCIRDSSYTVPYAEYNYHTENEPMHSHGNITRRHSFRNPVQSTGMNSGQPINYSTLKRS